MSIVCTLINAKGDKKTLTIATDQRVPPAILVRGKRIFRCLFTWQIPDQGANTFADYEEQQPHFAMDVSGLPFDADLSADLTPPTEQEAA
jgi:hypothetical protein